MKLKRNEGGFTLVEVLVSLALLSVMSVYAISAFRVQKDMDRMSVDIARKIEVRAALDVLRDKLQSMQLVFVPGQVASRVLIFVGHGDRVTFAGLSDDSRIEGGLYRITFLVNDKHALVVGFEPIKAAGFGKASSIVVLERVESVSFSYFGKLRGEPPFSEWPNQNELPRAMEIELRLQDKTQLIESVLAVELAQ